MQAARTAGGMALLGAPIMVVLFMLFPRMAPLWGVPSDAMAGRSGLSGSMQVGNIASLALDDSVAMRVRFEGGPPPQRDLYFRGPVLSTFNGREWISPRADFFGRRNAGVSLRVSGAPINYEITLEPTRRPWLLTLEALAQPPVLPGYEAAMQTDLQWLTNRPINDLLRYQGQSYPTFTHGPTRDDVALREFVELPPGFNPRTLALAADMRRDPRYAAATNAQLVQAVMERLRTGGFTYTLEPGVYGANTSDEFWFDRKEGFCEHIASSFVILMRALDVPARIVTGYQGGELNSVDGFWVVRQSDAHAWAEVWQPGQGWVRVDPTSAVSPGRIGAFQRLAAPQGVVGQALGTFSPTLVAQFRALWEATNNGWNQWVLNYTQGKQLNLLKNIGFQSPSWADLSYVLIVVVVLAAVVGGAWTLWDRTQHDPWLRLLARARKRLAKIGLASTPATSPRQLARLVLARYGERGRGLHDWLMELERQRYAETPTSLPGRMDSAQPQTGLRQLSHQFGRLAWPA
jgi:transglutaminase-like putative cysteine protease